MALAIPRFPPLLVSATLATVVLFIMPYKLIQTFEFVNEILECNDPNDLLRYCL